MSTSAPFLDYFLRKLGKRERRESEDDKGLQRRAKKERRQRQVQWGRKERRKETCAHTGDLN